jgi:hypothetical protein
LILVKEKDNAKAETGDWRKERLILDSGYLIEKDDLRWGLLFSRIQDRWHIPGLMSIRLQASLRGTSEFTISSFELRYR